MEMPKPTAPPCTRCGKQLNYLTTMLQPKTGEGFHMFECQCGDKSWISDKKK